MFYVQSVVSAIPRDVKRILTLLRKQQSGKPKWKQADFSGIADKAVHVSSVLQKTKLELDENGTKAAAVTAVTMECMSAMDTDPIIKDVELTRPFAFLIYDSANEEVLFMGKVLTVQWQKFYYHGNHLIHFIKNERKHSCVTWW